MRMFILLVLLANFVFSAVTTDSLKAKGSVLVVKDSTKFTGGAYFAGIARFAGTLYSPLAKIDTFTNSVIAKNISSDGTFIGLFKGQGSLPGYPEACYPTLKTDFLYTYFAANNKFVGSIGNDGVSSTFQLTDNSTNVANVLFQSNGPSYINGSLKVQACTTTTLNTGNVTSTGTVTATAFSGPLTGNVTGNVSGSSGSCTGNSATATKADSSRAAFIADTSKKAETAYSLNGGDLLAVYDTGSFPCTLKTSDVTVQQIGTAYYVKVGREAIYSFPKLIGTSNSGQLKMYCQLPYLPKQSDGTKPNESGLMVAMDANGMVLAYYDVFASSGYIAFGKTAGGAFAPSNIDSFTGSGNKGIYLPFTIKCVTEN